MARCFPDGKECCSNVRTASPCFGSSTQHLELWKKLKPKRVNQVGRNLATSVRQCASSTEVQTQAAATKPATSASQACGHAISKASAAPSAAGGPRWLTHKIKQASSWQELQHLVQHHYGALNHVHLTAITTRLADLTHTGHLSAARGSALRDFVHSIFELVSQQCTKLDARGYANVCWAVACLAQTGQAERDRCVQVLAQLLAHVQPHMPTLTSQQLSNTLWAAAVVDIHPGQQWLDHACGAVLAKMQSGEDVSSQCIANSLWALAELCYTPSAQFVQQLYVTSLKLSSSFAPQGIANLLCALANLQLQPPQQWLNEFLSTSQPCLPKFSNQALVNTIWACATLSQTPPISWQRQLLTVTLDRLPSLLPQELSSLLWAVASLQLQPEAAWVLAAARAVGLRLEALVLGSYSNTVNGAGTSRSLWQLQSISSVRSADDKKSMVINSSSGGWRASQSGSSGDSTWVNQVQPTSGVSSSSSCSSKAKALHPSNLQNTTGFSAQSLANSSWALASLQYSPPSRWLNLWQQAAVATLKRPCGSAQVMQILKAASIWTSQGHRLSPAWFDAALDAVGSILQQLPVDKQALLLCYLANCKPVLQVTSLPAFLQLAARTLLGMSVPLGTTASSPSLDACVATASPASVSLQDKAPQVDESSISSWTGAAAAWSANKTRPAAVAALPHRHPPSVMPLPPAHRRPIPSSTSLWRGKTTARLKLPATRVTDQLRHSHASVLPIMSSFKSTISTAQLVNDSSTAMQTANPGDQALPPTSQPAHLIVLACHSLARLGFSPHPAWFQQAMGRVNFKSIAGQDLSRLLWVCHRWKVPMTHLPIEQVLGHLCGDGFVDTTGNVSSQTFSTLLWGLARVRAPLTGTHRRQLVRGLLQTCFDLGPRDLAISLWAAARLHLPIRLRARRALLSAMQQLQPDMKLRDVEMCLWAFSRVKLQLRPAALCRLVHGSTKRRPTTSTLHQQARFLYLCAQHRQQPGQWWLQEFFSLRWQVRRFRVIDTVAVLVSLGRMGVCPPQKWMHTFWASTHWKIKSGRYSAGQLVTMLEAIPQMRLAVGARWMRAALQSLCQQCGTLQPASVTRMLVVLIRARAGYGGFMDSLDKLAFSLSVSYPTAQHLVAIPSMELLKWLLLWGALGVTPEREWVMLVANTAILHPNGTVESLSWVLEALHRVRHRPPRSWVIAYLRRVMPLLDSMSDQQVIRVAKNVQYFDKQVGAAWLALHQVQTALSRQPGMVSTKGS